MKKIVHVVGARPNFMKAAPVMRALQARDVEQVLVHTGQHYDSAMSAIFLQQLDLPEPDFNLRVGSGTHTRQTAEIMTRFEPLLRKVEPDGVLVYGDVNSTLAAALVCAKTRVRIGHVEAGLRSFDRTMPEEINRLLTDQIADLLFTPSKDADDNLLKEGVAPGKIHRVGNVMIDTLVRLLPKARKRSVLKDLGLEKGKFILVTLHRPSNVDSPQTLRSVITRLNQISEESPLVFPLHPRTRSRIQTQSLVFSTGVRVTDPLGYLDFLALEARARLVITDSGGIQEETSFLGIPCVTVRPNTERPITVELGTNHLVGTDMDLLSDTVETLQNKAGSLTTKKDIPLWDGQASQRIAAVIRGLP